MTNGSEVSTFFDRSSFMSVLVQHIRAAMAKPKQSEEERKIELALNELASFSENELNDFGLTRSNLTPEGLAVAGARHSLHPADNYINFPIARERGIEK